MNFFNDYNNNSFDFKNFSYFVTTKNEDDKNLKLVRGIISLINPVLAELDTEKKTLLLGFDWDTKGEMNNIVNFLENISKMPLMPEFKGLDIEADSCNCGIKIGDFFYKLVPEISDFEDRNIEKAVIFLERLSKIKHSRCIGNFFENTTILNDKKENVQINGGTISRCLGHRMSLNHFFNGNIDLCKRFFNILFPNRNIEVRFEGIQNKMIVVVYNENQIAMSED